MGGLWGVRSGAWCIGVGEGEGRVWPFVGIVAVLGLIAEKLLAVVYWGWSPDIGHGREGVEVLQAEGWVELVPDMWVL